MVDACLLAGRVATALERDWRSLARPEQLAPAGDWTIWLIKAGRGWGKSYSAAQWVREEVEGGRARRIALVGATAGDTRDIMIEGPSGLLSIAPSWNRPEYFPTKRSLVWRNGAVATLYSTEEPDRLRGPQFDCAWLDEVASWNKAQETFDMLMFGLRLGKNPRAVISTTPRPPKLVKDLRSRVGKDVVLTGGSTFENRDNLAPSLLGQVVAKYEGTRLGRQELQAELLQDVEGAL